MADLFKNTAANPMFPPPVAMPAQVPTSFEMWRSDPMNLAKINQPPEAAMAPNLPAIDKTMQPQPSPLEDSFIPPASGPEPVAPQMNLGGAPAPQLNAPPTPGFDVSGIMPKRPTSPYENMSGKKTALMGLATLADNIGAALSHGTPTVGKEWLGELANTRQRQQEYDANAPKLQYDLTQGVKSDALRNAATAAGTAHTTAETKNLQGQLSPVEARKAQFLSQISSDAESGQYSPDALKARALRMAQYNKIDVMPEEIDGAITGAPTKPPVFKTNAAGVIEPITYRGKVYGPKASQDDPPEIIKGRNEVMDSLNLATKTAEDKEKRVAGYAADRTASATQTAMSTADTKKGKELASKYLESLRSAENQNELVQQLASSKSPTDQTSLAFKALGLDLPDGVHRINETELNAIRNQGGLSDRAQKAILNWQKGQQFAPEILQDIAKTASTISASKIKNANDNLDDVERVYGYKAPRGASKQQSGGGEIEYVRVNGKLVPKGSK
jgi:hypothetical protein